MDRGSVLEFEFETLMMYTQMLLTLSNPYYSNRINKSEMFYLLGSYRKTINKKDNARLTTFLC